MWVSLWVSFWVSKRKPFKYMSFRQQCGSRTRLRTPQVSKQTPQTSLFTGFFVAYLHMVFIQPD